MTTIHLQDAQVETTPIIFDTDPDVAALQTLGDIHFRAHQTAGFSVSGSLILQVPMDTTDWNTGPGTFAGNVYTCGLAGFYRVRALVSITASATSQWFQTFVRQNGTNTGDGPTSYATTVGNTLSSAAEDVMHLALNDTVDIGYGTSTSGTGLTGASTYLLIDCIGPY